MHNIDIIKSSINTAMTQADYYKMSEDRKVVTPENLGGLLEYPKLFRAMQDDRELRPALSEAMSTGRAMSDFLTLSAEDFSKNYTIADGPVNPRTNLPYGHETKAYAEWRAQQEKEPISTAQFNMFGKMAEAYNQHRYITDLSGMERLRNVIISAKVCGIDVCCKIDNLYVSDKTVIAVDVKTAEDLIAFRSASTRLHYREQQALIKLVLNIIGIPDAQVRIAAIEKGKMPRCGIFGVENLDTFALEVENSLTGYADSCASGNFNTGFEAPCML